MAKRLVLMMIAGFALSACNGEASITIKEDSVKSKVERLGDEVDSMAKNLKDSGQKEMRVIKEKVQSKIENRKEDTIRK